MCQINSYLLSVGVAEFFAESEKICGWEIFLNLKLNTRLPEKKRKLDVDALERKEKIYVPNSLYYHHQRLSRANW